MAKLNRSTEKILVEMDQRKIFVQKLLNGHEIREAMANLEKLRQEFNEEEFLYGAKIYLEFDGYRDWWVVIKRPETDKEFQARWDKIAKSDKAKEQQKERLKIKKAEQAAKKAEEEAKKELEELHRLAEKHGLKIG